MRYRSFRIQNFKGIRDTTVSLGGGNASIFALVGLNESGKTTILEAIHSFSPDTATSELVGGGGAFGVPYTERVPRHQIANFTGRVSVTATVEVTDSDKVQIARTLKVDHGITIDTLSIPEQIDMERWQVFDNGDFKASYFSLGTTLHIRTGKQRRWRTPRGTEEIVSVRDVVYSLTPNISYFPTFIFDFPEAIYLTDRGTKVDRFYRSVLQDILDSSGHKYQIQRDIIDRIRSADKIKPWSEFWNFWTGHDDQDKIQQIMDRASASVTQIVLGRWNSIFGENSAGKEIIITYNVVEGEVKNAQGVRTKTNEHDVNIGFRIKDGSRRFDVNTRSLGFRWFFAFMLFTQFRVARAGSRPLLFLFDEPAANLHAAAQQKLVESFPSIARSGHMLAYSTHSHYMIEPKWLEQTFIVTNRNDDPSDSVLGAVSLDDESLDIKATPYRAFVNDHPHQTSYFQPVLDRLEVVPSKFDMTRDAIVIEGKSDYYILRYAEKLLKKGHLPLIPGLGSGTFGALVALQVGWNLNSLFLLDGDAAGKKEKNRYMSDYCIPEARIITVDELVGGIKEIEDLLDVTDVNKVVTELQLQRRPSKKEICRFFQERLASENIAPLSKSFRARSKGVLNALSKRLKS